MFTDVVTVLAPGVAEYMARESVTMSSESGRSEAPVAILVTGPSSSGKSTLCRALQERLSILADGDPTAIYARVAFDDIVALIPDTLYPISFVALNGGDLGRLASRQPYDGRAAWEYLDDQSDPPGEQDDSPRIRLVISDDPGDPWIVRLELVDDTDSASLHKSKTANGPGSCTIPCKREQYCAFGSGMAIRQGAPSLERPKANAELVPP